MANFAEGNDITGTDLLEWSRHQSSATSCIKKKGKRSTYSGMISLITPGIYLGNKAASSDLDLLKRLSIVAIINIGGGKCYFPIEFEYFRIAIKDSDEVPYLPYFEEACNFAQFWKKRGSILFHCRGGMHRSPCFLAAHLIRNESLSMTQALTVISLGRPIANPTPHMVSELKEFEKLINKS
ncbi:Dual specificity protein phosphatase [Oopsacas minuta]|uniref:protein-tyrosine-phosphatase n=1 Tax=Oopsacas minuta TaxID=111878 RepID=A0AAV7JK20_9METZ|nr:Dual specificity protein phosphatase [Oopsacas minuta]